MGLVVYPASKVAPHCEHWRALRGAGLDIRASWLDAELNISQCEPTATQWADHWSACVSEAAAADIVLFFDEGGRVQKGALIEVGCALAAGKEVYAVSAADFNFLHHPRVRKFASLEAAVRSILARQAGERAREAAMRGPRFAVK